MNVHKFFFLSIIIIFSLNSCGGKLPGADAKKYPPNPKERVKKNLEEGRGFRLDDAIGGGNKSGKFDFASSNELWRAALDVIDFMPLTSANYSGGIIITDWFAENQGSDSIKITIRFLSNEVRSDALSIKIFYKKCDANLNCTVNEKLGELNKELQKEILKTAAIYEKQKKDKGFRPYKGSMVKTDD
ncbi:DUF3576 domain-containing protein [Candidatus Pelagibacter sp.]|nr:DUF3576 domain-containing protein [Candidatus Pelagibacter sp.]